MYLLTRERLAAYASHDRVLGLLAELERPPDRAFTSHQWLLQSQPKRLMYDGVYGDLVSGRPPRRRILDVGGGFCAATRRLIADHDYTLVEINAHDQAMALREVERQSDCRFWVEGDWHDQRLEGPWDLVLANDLFPNVDQRLVLFLDKFMPVAREIRVSLTYYTEPRFYMARRLQGDEVLCVLAWDGEQTRRAMNRYVDRLDEPDLDLLTTPTPSIFPNGRQVCIARLVPGAAGQ